jgi:lysophospholipase L1-like esterase
MRTSLLGAITATSLLGATLLAVPAVGSEPVTPVEPAYTEYVAMGDSFTASTGFSTLPDTRFVPIGCTQSKTDYPHQVAAMLQVATFVDASCGGATIDNLAGPQKTFGGINAPQLDRLTPTTDLVTIGISGNDIGMVQVSVECAIAGLTLTSCKAQNTKGGVDRVSARIAATQVELEAAVQAVKERSPHARVILVNYLESVPDSGRACFPLVPVRQVDMPWLSDKFKEMNAMIAAAAANTGADLADTYTPTIGHSVCAPPRTRYVETVGVLTLNPIGSISAPLHPNIAGATAQAAAVYAEIISAAP